MLRRALRGKKLQSLERISAAVVILCSNKSMWWWNFWLESIAIPK